MVNIIVDEDRKLSYFSMLGECVSEPMNLASAIIGSALWNQFFFSNNYTPLHLRILLRPELGVYVQFAKPLNLSTNRALL